MPIVTFRPPAEANQQLSIKIPVPTTFHIIFLQKCEGKCYFFVSHANAGRNVPVQKDYTDFKKSVAKKPAFPPYQRLLQILEDRSLFFVIIFTLLLFAQATLNDVLSGDHRMLNPVDFMD
jgi:hypothetical protein